MLFVTDPARTADPLGTASRLPSGAGVILRHFGASDAETTGRALLAVARRRGLVVLVGADPDLAETIGADGVHLPERLAKDATALRARRPNWLITAAWHGAAPPPVGEALDALLVSPVLPSASPSAGAPLGVEGLRRLASQASRPVYALGGITADNAALLKGSGACGIAAVEGVAAAYRA